MTKLFHSWFKRHEQRHSVHRRCYSFVFFTMLLVSGLPVEATPKSLLPDLSFLFDCEQKRPAIVEEKLEEFLIGNKFDVLNVVRIRRQNQLPPLLSHLFIDGLDDRKRMIRFMSIPNTTNTYTVLLNTPPPTNRSSDLEMRMIGLVENTLGCRVRDVRRHENGSEAKEMFDAVLEDVRRNFTVMKGLGKI